MSKMSLDKEAITLLAQILQETGLSEIEYERDNLRIKVSSNKMNAQFDRIICSNEVAATALNGTTNSSIPVATQNLQPATANFNEQNSGNVDNIVDFAKTSQGVVKSPMVGTVYVSPSPNDAPFVKIGDKVTKGQTLLIIEAMKVLNMIKSPRDGVVKTLFVKNEDPVEYDQPLLIVE